MITIHILDVHVKPSLSAVVNSVVENMRSRSAGITLHKCLLDSNQTLAVLLGDELQNINAGRYANQSVITPNGVDCINLFITLNKLKTYVVSK